MTIRHRYTRRPDGRTKLHTHDYYKVIVVDDENTATFPNDTRTLETYVKRNTISKRSHHAEVESFKTKKSLSTEKNTISYNVVHDDWSYHTSVRSTVRTTVANVLVEEKMTRRRRRRLCYRR